MTQRILLMEEHDLSRYAAAELLRSSGCTVTESSDETQALDLLKKHHFDVLILGMLTPCPGSFGLLVWARLKWPGMRIIVTADVSKAEIEEIIFGEVVFLHKPFDAAELEAAVTGLDRHHGGTTYH
jgi:CheY-like chemotaxis protein